MLAAAVASRLKRSWHAGLRRRQQRSD
jgi:hypothetical protein